MSEKEALDKADCWMRIFHVRRDIDSYRLQLSGYRNVYYPLTTIIHYEEITRKGINYQSCL
jgi:GT2 family glycosyltransferase